MFEKDKRVAIFACYEDTEKTLINYIVKELTGFKGLTGEIINLIITNSGSNRKIIQNEIVKIKVFFFNKLINKNQIIEILNIKNDSGFEEIRDTALVGKKDKINKLLSELNLLSEDSFFYLNSLNYRILKLIEIQKINETYKNHEQALESLKPHIFWKDKPIYLQQLKKWDMTKLNKAANKISYAEILMKKNSIVRNDIVIKDLIISLTEEASTSF
jgi:DNA polymerase-3 subunit delta